MDFYTIILILAGVALIIALSGIGLAVSNGKSIAGFPSYVNSCPDYWTKVHNSASSVGYTCSSHPENKGKLTTSSYTPTGKVCEDSAWAKINKIYWDGISNNRDAKTCPTPSS